MVALIYVFLTAQPISVRRLCAFFVLSLTLAVGVLAVLRERAALNDALRIATALTHYHEKKVVETSDSFVYVRIGDSKRKLSRDEIHELQRDKGQVDFEQEPTTLSYPTEFNESLIQEFANNVAAAYGVESARSSEEILVYRD